MRTGDGFSFVDINHRARPVEIYENNKWQMLIAGLIAALACLILFSLISPTHQGTARIVIEDGQRQSMRTTIHDTTNLNYTARQIDQIDIIRSNHIALKVIEKFGLSDWDEFASPMTLWSSPANFTAQERALIRFYEKLSVSAIKNSPIVLVQFSSSDPKIAKAVPNAIVDEYLALQYEARLGIQSVDAVNARIISRATLPKDARFQETIIIAFLSAISAMVLYFIALWSYTIIISTGARSGGLIPRDFVPDSVDTYTG